MLVMQKQKATREEVPTNIKERRHAYKIYERYVVLVELTRECGPSHISQREREDLDKS